MMKVKENIGMINALLRIAAGLTLVAYGTAKLTRKPWRNCYLFTIICGAMKVAEGMVRYCPITDLLQKKNCCIRFTDNQEPSEKPDLAITNIDEPLDYNPT